jgi:hypothetical protein
MAKAEVTRNPSRSGGQVAVFPQNGASRVATLYELAAFLRACAAREADYHRRRQLEKRCRACQRAAREAMRSTLGQGAPR